MKILGLIALQLFAVSAHAAGSFDIRNYVGEYRGEESSDCAVMVSAEDDEIVLTVTGASYREKASVINRLIQKNMDQDDLTVTVTLDRDLTSLLDRMNPLSGRSKSENASFAIWKKSIHNGSVQVDEGDLNFVTVTKSECKGLFGCGGYSHVCGQLKRVR